MHRFSRPLSEADENAIEQHRGDAFFFEPSALERQLELAAAMAAKGNRVEIVLAGGSVIEAGEILIENGSLRIFTRPKGEAAVLHMPNPDRIEDIRVTLEG